MTAANGGSLDPSGNPGVSGDAGVLYVQLPEGHPVITGGTTDEGIVQNSDTVLPGDTCTNPCSGVAGGIGWYGRCHTCISKFMQ